MSKKEYIVEGRDVKNSLVYRVVFADSSEEAAKLSGLPVIVQVYHKPPVQSKPAPRNGV